MSNEESVTRAKKTLESFQLKYANIYKPTVIFDIDGTLISNKGEPNSSVVSLHEQAIRMGFSTFIITARTNYKDGLEYTSKQLEECGVLNYTRLIFRPNAFADISIFKKNARKDIFDEGYTVLMSVGNEACDVGDYGGLGVLV